MRYLIRSSFILLIFSLLFGQSVRLNEIVTSNGDNLYDEDGETPDWIELHNPTNELIDLLGFGITDDPEDLSKWTFPSIALDPDDFLVVFASDKDRKEYVVQWDAKIETPGPIG